MMWNIAFLSDEWAKSYNLFLNYTNYCSFDESWITKYPINLSINSSSVYFLFTNNLNHTLKSSFMNNQWKDYIKCFHRNVYSLLFIENSTISWENDRFLKNIFSYKLSDLKFLHCSCTSDNSWPVQLTHAFWCKQTAVIVYNDINKIHYQSCM